jgi:hypothetical protein
VDVTQIEKIRQCSMYSNRRNLLRAKILPEEQSVTGDFGDGEDGQELACAHKEV